MKACFKCGRSNPDNAMYCRKCGEYIGENLTERADKSNGGTTSSKYTVSSSSYSGSGKSSKNIWTGVVVVVLVILTIWLSSDGGFEFEWFFGFAIFAGVVIYMIRKN